MFKRLSPTAAVVAMGTLLPTAGHAQIVVDGTAEAAYGASKAVQNAPTDYGDNTTSTIAPSRGGSELDSAYGIIRNGTLYITVTGNFENNGYAFLFIDTGSGGQNVLNNPVGSYNGLSNFNGMKFDSAVSVGYDVIAHASGMSSYLGSTSTFGPGTTGVLSGGTNPFNILSALNDSNVSGVSGAGAAGAVLSGAEFGIPLSAIGGPAGPIRVIALLAGSGDSGVSNQVLGAVGSGLNGNSCPGIVDFTTVSGSQYFTVTAAPESSGITSLLIGAAVFGGAVIVRCRQAA